MYILRRVRYVICIEMLNERGKNIIMNYENWELVYCTANFPMFCFIVTSMYILHFVSFKIRTLFSLNFAGSLEYIIKYLEISDKVFILFKFSVMPSM